MSEERHNTEAMEASDVLRENSVRRFVGGILLIDFLENLFLVSVCRENNLSKIACYYCNSETQELSS
jgi:hypothetical protein